MSDKDDPEQGGALEDDNAEPNGSAQPSEPPGPAHRSQPPAALQPSVPPAGPAAEASSGRFIFLALGAAAGLALGFVLFRGQPQAPETDATADTPRPVVSAKCPACPTTAPSVAKSPFLKGPSSLASALAKTGAGGAGGSAGAPSSLASAAAGGGQSDAAIAAACSACASCPTAKVMKGKGTLRVKGPAIADVYVDGELAGGVDSPLAVDCGKPVEVLLRIGKHPASKPVKVDVACDKLTEVTIKHEPTP